MTFKLADGLFIVGTDDGIALIDEESGRHRKLDPVAALALGALLWRGSVEEAAKALTQEFAMGTDDAGQRVRELVSELESEGLLEE